ncbi:uncharacterized protein [Chlorocebus sabaeus]|uniref:uncharacterized protein n=1 Tax=Chlorocebus sabaeus TaxID=60711 RepID=UPI003BF9F6E1
MAHLERDAIVSENVLASLPLSGSLWEVTAAVEPDETPGLTEGGRESYEEGILKNLLLGREDGKLSQSAVLHPIPQPHMPAHSRDLPTLLGKASELLPQDVL